MHALHFRVAHSGKDVVKGGKALQTHVVGTVICEENAGSRLAEGAAVALKSNGDVALNAHH